MNDLPGPEKPLGLDPETKLNPNQLMEQFRARLRSQPEMPRRLRPVGAGGSGAYTGRSGEFLKGRVRPRHEMVVMLQVCGWKNNEIAAAMGYTPARISVILNSKHPKLQQVRKDAVERVAKGTTDLQAKFALYAPDALNRMVDIMEQTADLANARLAARDILDRAGYSPVKKVAAMHTSVPLDQLAGALTQIEKANEAVMRQGEWEVRQFKDGAA